MLMQTQSSVLEESTYTPDPGPRGSRRLNFGLTPDGDAGPNRNRGSPWPLRDASPLAHGARRTRKASPSAARWRWELVGAHVLPERLPGELDEPLVVGEEEDLRPSGELRQDFEPHARPRVIEVDEGVVEDERQRPPLLEVPLEARDPKREVELIPRPLAQAVHRDGSASGPHTFEHPLVDAHAQTLEALQAQAREQVGGAAQHGTLMALPVPRDLPFEDAASEPEARVLGCGLPNLRRGLGE